MCDSDAFFDAMEKISEDNKVDLCIFNYIVGQKDDLIAELREKIKILHNHIDLLNTCRSTSLNEGEQQTVAINSGCVKNIPDRMSNKKFFAHETAETSSTNVKVNKNIENNVALESADLCFSSAVKHTRSSKMQNVVTNKQLSRDLINAECQLALDKYINLAKDDKVLPVEPPTATQSIRRNPGANQCKDAPRKKRRRSIITGSSDILTGRVKGVPRMVALHVYRVSPFTTARDLEELLHSNFPEVSCEVITSKHPNIYSSFKVNIFESNFKAAMNPKLWPYGTCIQRFFEIARKDHLPK